MLVVKISRFFKRHVYSTVLRSCWPNLKSKIFTPFYRARPKSPVYASNRLSLPLSTILKSLITITPRITRITNQGSDSSKYNKPQKESRERDFTNITKIQKIIIIARITEITNEESDTGKYNKSLKGSWEGT